MDVVLLALAASGTALATGLGAVPVFFMGTRAEFCGRFCSAPRSAP